MKIHLDLNAGGKTQFDDSAQFLIANRIEELAKANGVQFIETNDDPSPLFLELSNRGKLEFENWLKNTYGKWAIAHFSETATYSIVYDAEDIFWVVSGEGKYGTPEFYLGVQTSTAINARLKKEKSGGRWAVLKDYDYNFITDINERFPKEISE